MIKPKLKVCAGHDGIEHEAYIYKNINGKKYCKSCTFKLEPNKSVFKVHIIKKVSDKQKLKLEAKKRLLQTDFMFYLECWRAKFMNNRLTEEYEYDSEPRCEVCNKFLGYEPNLTFFHHVLEKRNYPEYRHEKRNIAIICPQCHNTYETMPDKVPYLVVKRNLLLKDLLKEKTIKNESEQ